MPQQRSERGLEANAFCDLLQVMKNIMSEKRKKKTYKTQVFLPCDCWTVQVETNLCDTQSFFSSTNVFLDTWRMV